MSDVVVVGGGSAGLTAARTAVGLGARVALVDQERLGGECLWSGCVPSKSLIAAARAAHVTRRLGEFGLRGELAPVDLAAVMDRVHGVVAAIDRGEDAAAMRKGLGVLDLARTVHVYPTFAMGVQQAALGYYGRTPFYRLMRGRFGPLARRALS